MPPTIELEDEENDDVVAVDADSIPAAVAEEDDSCRCACNSRFKGYIAVDVEGVGWRLVHDLRKEEMMIHSGEYRNNNKNESQDKGKSSHTMRITRIRTD